MIWFCLRCRAIRRLNNSTRAREGNSLFTVASTVANFLLQNCAVLCNAARIRFPETPGVCNGAQACENVRNSLGLN